MHDAARWSRRSPPSRAARKVLLHAALSTVGLAACSNGSPTTASIDACALLTAPELLKILGDGTV